MTLENTSPSIPQFFNQGMASNYDDRNRRLSPISENMHFLPQLVLADLPQRARILCIGVGTGAEILSIADKCPEWTFVGVDPSAEMLSVCRRRLTEANLLERCELVQGYVTDAPEGPNFDAALSILVAHFVPHGDRSRFYRGIFERLKPGGVFVSTEISCDLDDADFPALLKNWELIQTLMGATPQALDNLPDMLRIHSRSFHLGKRRPFSRQQASLLPYSFSSPS